MESIFDYYISLNLIKYKVYERKEMMNILTNTHIFIGKRVLEIIKDSNIPFELNKNLFIYGNIEPDIPLKGTPIKHKREEGLPFILKKIEELKNMRLNTQKDIDIFSLNVGIICHYLSDFYCLPHVQRWGDYKGLKHVIKGFEHIFYEFKISFHKDEIKKVVKHKFYTIDDIEKFLLSSFEAYEDDSNLKKDVFYATLVCNSVVHYILLNQKTFIK